jgi:hypothetical protein
MTTRRENILARLATVLANTSGVSGRVYRSRVEPLARGEMPALVVEPVSDTPEQTTVASLDWTLQARVSVLVRGAVPDQLADPIVESVHAKIMEDQTLNGYAIDVLPGGVTFEMVEADQPAGVIGMDFEIRYRTSLASISG